MDFIYGANELSIRSWDELLNIKERLDRAIAEPTEELKSAIETINRKFSTDGEKADKKYPRGFWMHGKVIKSYILAKKAFEYSGKSIEELTTEDLRPYCSTSIYKPFGNMYKMMCLLTGKRLSLSTLKQYSNKVVTTNIKLKKFSNIDLNELDMHMLGFTDMLKHYLCESYVELFESMNIDTSEVLVSGTVAEHAFKLLITPGVSYDELYDYFMSFNSIILHKKIDCRKTLCVLSEKIGWFEAYRKRRYIARISKLFPDLNISIIDRYGEYAFFDIIAGKTVMLSTTTAKLHFIK